MPRIKDQTIPSELRSLYTRILTPARPIPNPGSSSPALPDQISDRYPWHITKPPTPPQLTQREIFRNASACFGSTTDNERAAYFALADYRGLWYYDLFMSRAILAMLDGQTCPNILRPEACYCPEESDPWGWVDRWVDFSFLCPDLYSFNAHITSDILTYTSHYPACPYTLGLQIEKWWLVGGDWTHSTIISIDLAPTAQVEYDEIIPFSTDGLGWYRCVLYRNTNDSAPTVAWAITDLLGWGTLRFENFAGP